ncbi:MAG TPA: SDR family NAD(P)-dependent oxidoreductase [Usitatibacter sp.]|jgi:NAD(P)-dependent dehydrogenase (short-subunit alcohol dehydrogenase family)|nr:SDR family NAD(P)-dependent oxidoreductase [Usitatibacter sp.]
MRELKGKTAVVTGAGSGIGRELAIACAREGMSVALADVDEKGMQATAIEVAKLDMRSESIRCDVSKASEVDLLAARACDRFGGVHLVFNNAGVAVGGPAWTATLEDWQWTLGINLMGVVHGMRSFVPRMLEQGGECHMVNTASVAGLVDIPGSAVYCVSKHGVVALSECLYHDLRVAKSSIGVSVLCPAYVNTGIGDSDRNRPADLAATNPLGAPYREAVREALKHGRLSAADVAREAIEAVKTNRFYILPHGRIKGAIEARMRDILEERLPTDVSRPIPGAGAPR